MEENVLRTVRYHNCQLRPVINDRASVVDLLILSHQPLNTSSGFNLSKRPTVDSSEARGFLNISSKFNWKLFKLCSPITASMCSALTFIEWDPSSWGVVYQFYSLFNTSDLFFVQREFKVCSGTQEADGGPRGCDLSGDDEEESARESRWGRGQHENHVQRGGGNLQGTTRNGHGGRNKSLSVIWLGERLCLCTSVDILTGLVLESLGKHTFTEKKAHTKVMQNDMPMKRR